MTYVSPNGEGGFSGEVKVTVFFRVNPGEYSLYVDYEMESKEETPLGLTCHAHFNLGGEKNILNNYLRLPADKYYTTLNKAPDKPIPVIPLLDFRESKRLGDVCGNPSLPPYGNGGVDFIYGNNGRTITLENDKYRLDVETDMPTAACYTNNYPRDGILLSNGNYVEKFSSCALECEEIPNDFDAIAVKPGKTKYRHIHYVFHKK